MRHHPESATRQRREEAAGVRPDPEVAVFDLDGTLLRGDAFSRFGRQLVCRSLARAAATAVCAPVLGALLVLPPTRRFAAAGLLWLATAGLSAESFTRHAERFAVRHTAREAGNRIPVALDRLRGHLAAGHRVIVATSCPDPLATAICRELGLDGVEVIAAQLRPGRSARSGMRPVRGCRGAQKVGRLHAAGVATPVGYAYTDSAVDIPLLLAARHRYLIAPSPGHLRVILDKVGRGCEVLE